MVSCGVGQLVSVKGNMDRFQYKSVLEIKNQWILQQDNDPKHAVHVVRD